MPAVQAAGTRKIAFTFGGSNNTTTEIFVVNEDGTGQQRLTTNGIEDTTPTWSPDGSQLAFASNRGGTFNIFRMNADGSGQVPVTNSAQGVANTDPAWSPDAQRFAFISNRGGAGRTEIWLIGADGNNPQQLTVNRELTSDSFGPVYSQDREPAWSPDGTRIAFSSNRDELGNFDIYVMNSDGSNPVRLTTSNGDDGDPTWSPDGARIAFTSTRDGNHEVYVMNADGGGQTNLTNFSAGNDFQPSWSQDGASIAFVRGENHIDSVMTLYRMGADGSNQVLVAGNAPSDSWTPVWQTLGGPAAPPAPSAPGYRLTGRVMDFSRNPAGTGLGGIRMELGGAQSAVTQTDASGNYSFDNLAANSTFNVRPMTTSYGYVPASQTFSTGAPENSVGSGGTITKDFTASPIFVQFGATSDSVSEGSGPRAVTVERVGFLTGESTVDYAVGGGTATAGSDYMGVSGTLRFGPGESAKSIVVPILNDSADEADETVILKLSNPTGALLGARDTFVLTIQDDDLPPSLVDDSQFFVRQHYLDFLSREPDRSGWDFWTSGIETCGANSQCREVKRIDTSAAFFLSIEFQETGYLVYRTYKAAYGDATSPNVSGTVPVIRLQEFLPDTQEIGRDVQVNVGDWQRQLEANKQAYMLEFVGRQRFLNAFPSTLTADEFVSKLDQNAGSVLLPAEKAQLVSGLSAAPADAQKRAATLRQVAESATLRQREFNRAFVLMQYFGYLRRNPDDAPNTDFRGWQFWLSKLEQFQGDFRRAEMVKAFLESNEYRGRFAQ